MADILKQAITTIKAGDTETGRHLLELAVQTEPDNDMAWLWLASVAESPADSRAHLERALTINPDNRRAQRELANLSKKTEGSPAPTHPTAAVPVPSSIQPDDPTWPNEAPTTAPPPADLSTNLVDQEAAFSAPSARPPGMYDAFISYSRKDKVFVQRLYEALQARGQKIWVDWDGIPLSADWRAEIREGIENANAVIFVISPDSLASKEVGVEREWAEDLNKRLIPLVYRDVTPKAVPPSLASLNWIFCRETDNFEAAMVAVLDVLETDLAWVKTHTRLLMRAIEWDKNERNQSFLLRGDDLHQAERSLMQNYTDPQPTPLQHEYVVTSRQYTDRRQRLFLGRVTFALVVSILLAVFAFIQFWRAQEATQHALASKLAAESVVFSDDQLDLALLLNLEAGRIAEEGGFGDEIDVLAGLKYSPYLTTFLHGHTDVVRRVAFSPDGRLAVSAGRDNRIMMWNPALGQPLGQPLLGHTDWIYGLAVSPDGQTIASGSFDETVRLWDVATGQPKGEPLTGHKGQVWGVAFSPNGQILASGGDDNTVRLWDVATGQPLGEPLTGHTDLVMQVAFGPAPVETSAPAAQAPLFSPPLEEPEGLLLASTGRDGTIRLWDVATGQPRGEPLSGHKGLVWDIAFSPDGSRLVSAGNDDQVVVWDVAAGRQAGFHFDDHDSPVYAVAVSPDGQTVASAGDDKQIILWDIDTREPLGPPLTGHTAWVSSLAFSPDGDLLISGSADNTPILWNVGVGQFLSGHQDWVYDVAYSPNGTRLASASYDDTVRLWNPATRQAVGPPLTSHSRNVWAVAFSPDGQILASGSADNTVRLWDGLTGQALGEPLTGHTDEVVSVQFSPAISEGSGGQILASAGVDGLIILWDVDSRQAVGQLSGGHTDEIRAIEFSPDGALLATASNDQTIRLWAVATGQPLGEPIEGHTDWVTSVAFSPDGQLLASGSADNTVRLWDVATRRPLGEPIEGHTNRVWDVAFSPNGRLLVSGGADRRVILWDVETRRPLGPPLSGHVNLVTAVAFSPDGQHVVSGSADNTVVIWNVDAAPWPVRACQIANRNMTQAEWDEFLGDYQSYHTTCPGVAGES